MAQILVVDDEIGIRELMSEILSDEGHTVHLAENATAAREWRARVTPERIGLVRPVELAGPRGEAVEMMLGALVIAHDRFELGGVGHGSRKCIGLAERR